ncbi:MAG: hypothetical protein ACYTGX_17525 [Planctomycetota bacterium]|jgi:hypothetical protein
MRLLASLAGFLLFAPVLQEPAPPAGVTAAATDASGTTVTLTEATFVQEESESGTLYLTRLPYVPLKTGRGEWRIPLAAIARIDVTPPATPAALRTPGHWRARLRVALHPEGQPAVSTVESTGVLPLDAALGMAAATLPFTPATGTDGAAQRPLLLDATVQLREVPQAAPVIHPILSLKLRNGETAQGRPTGPLILEGTRGAGTFRIGLRDCRSVTLGK